MFTRRSVLKLLSTWVCHGIFDQSNVVDGVFEQSNVANGVFDQSNIAELTQILTNAISDFDWEIRSACFNVLFTIITKLQIGALDFVHEILNDVIMLGLKDTEYKVRTKVLECLKEMQVGLFAAQQHNSDLLKELPLNGESSFEVSTIDELRQFLTSYNFKKALHDLTEMDVKVKDDSVSFMQDILFSAKKADNNLLIDCY